VADDTKRISMTLNQDNLLKTLADDLVKEETEMTCSGSRLRQIKAQQPRLAQG